MAPPSGTTGNAIIDDKGVYMAISAFVAVTWYNVAELNIQVFLTFKRHRGLYFWSLLISSWGCVLHALGFLLKFFQLTTNNYLSVTIITIGWYSMVTGQSVVLYSRLHLVVRERRILHGVLAMICTDAVLFHIPTTVLTYGCNVPNPTHNFLAAFNVMEKLQMTMFSVQEFIISGIYVWATLSLLRPVYHGRTRKVMMQLIWINLVIIGMDVALLVIEYRNLYDIEATIKAMIYSIKLKLEFSVLNQLMTLANSSVNNHQNLHIIEDDHLHDNEKDLKPPPGRSKSTEYISSKYKKPSRKERRASKKAAQARSQSLRNNGFAGLEGAHHGFHWVPDLDRHAFIDAKHVEHLDSEPELNVYTNPAACYRPGGRKANIPEGFLSHDGLGGIPDSPVASPALTGTTLEAALQAGNTLDSTAATGGATAAPTTATGRRSRPTSANPTNRHSGHSAFRFSRRALRPLSGLNQDSSSSQPGSAGHSAHDLSRQVMPNGLLRSTRPSVSDWAHGPDSEGSTSSSISSLGKDDNNNSAPPTRGNMQRFGSFDSPVATLRRNQNNNIVSNMSKDKAEKQGSGHPDETRPGGLGGEYRSDWNGRSTSSAPERSISGPAGGTDSGSGGQQVTAGASVRGLRPAGVRTSGRSTSGTHVPTSSLDGGSGNAANKFMYMTKSKPLPNPHSKSYSSSSANASSGNVTAGRLTRGDSGRLIDGDRVGGNTTSGDLRSASSPPPQSRLATLPSQQQQQQQQGSRHIASQAISRGTSQSRSGVNNTSHAARSQSQHRQQRSHPSEAGGLDFMTSALASKEY